MCILQNNGTNAPQADLEELLDKMNSYCQCMHGAAGKTAGWAILQVEWHNYFKLLNRNDCQAAFAGIWRLGQAWTTSTPSSISPIRSPLRHASLPFPDRKKV